MSFIDDIVSWFVITLSPYSRIPEATVFIIGIAIALGLMSSTAAKLLVDYKMVRNVTKEYQAWRRELDKARKTNDNQQVSKLMKKQQAMMKLQSRASMEQFKVTAVTFVPFLLIWYLLSAVFTGHVVAVAPFWLPFIGDEKSPMNMQFFQWYFLTSFAVNFPMMRLFGIGMSDS